MATLPPRREPVPAGGFWSGMAEIYRQMVPARRRHFYVLLTLMLIGAGAELATIGAVLPFLSLLADPSTLDRFPAAAALFAWLRADSLDERLIAATALFALIVVFAGLVRFELARSMQQFGHRLAHELTLELQRRFLFQPYSFHVERNTSTLISALDKAEMLVFEVLIPLMQAVIAGFIALFIVGALIAIDPRTAIIAALAFSLMYLLVSAVTSAPLARNSQAVARGFDERLKVVQESLGGIRDVIVDGSQPMYLKLFDRESSKLNRARANTVIIASAPRFIIEILGIVAIAAIAFIASQREGGLAAALPVLGAIALGAQRLLPLVQQVYKGWSTTKGYLSVVGQTADQLRLPVDDRSTSATGQPLPLQEKVKVENVSFTYAGRRCAAINNVSFEFPAGSAVALVGETGSGKSTLADLLMGLLEPQEGQICIDGVPLTTSNRRRWQQSIAHVPQSIFLADSSIARNIALGRGDADVDTERVIAAARTAQLHEFITSLSEGYDTFVGERGIRLSGGQRQRLGIARAIYKQTPVLVLDEATSALDEATEAAVMDGLYQLGDEGRTIIIIAHRVSTVSRCDYVVRLPEGHLVAGNKLGELAQPAKPARTRASDGG